jgi:hypothetical protein
VQNIPVTILKSSVLEPIAVAPINKETVARKKIIFFPPPTRLGTPVRTIDGCLELLQDNKDKDLFLL